MKLDRSQIHTQTKLVKAFLAQYDYVVDTAPDCISLITMEKKETKSCKDYTQRWRDLASQVQPHLIEKETTFIFTNTLPTPQYDKMIGNVMRNFSEMVWSGELIKHAVKNKKLEEKTTLASLRRIGSAQKKEGETQVVFTNHQYRGHALYLNQPSYFASNLPPVQPLIY